VSKTEAGSGTIPFTEYDTSPEEVKVKFWLGTGFVPSLFRKTWSPFNRAV
jgi:hypothetical protein